MRGIMDFRKSEAFDSAAQFFTLAAGGGVNIWQPKPMFLGGIAPALAVAHLAQAHGAGLRLISARDPWPLPYVFNWLPVYQTS